ncbi:MAG TPA: DUF2795 domain-containing protein [Ktedonobacteraceae bacterium]|nr:DUF2795 domain-containing protein [Ktedonobacteraceae bacterium]
MAVSPKEVEKYLAGVDYPARKQDLIKRAEQNNAPQEVLDTIKRMPDETFNKPTDVAKAIGQFA